MLMLSSTSALVLLWAGNEVYRSFKARQYLQQLNLEAGLALYRQCLDIWPYYDEVIKNRKFAVLTFLDRCCGGGKEGRQVVIVGAGLDPLGIELTQRYPAVQVFELDRENMQLKSGLCAQLDRGREENLRFIDVDVLHTADVCDRLKEAGWNASKPSVMVCEGISYYLPPSSVARLAFDLDPERMIFEYLKPERDLDVQRIDIPRRIFGLIAEQCVLPTIERYDSDKAERTFDMRIGERYGMMKLEKMRTGENRFFPTESSGWIEVCLLERRTDCKPR